MNPKKLNACLGLAATVLGLFHIGFYSLWCLSKGQLPDIGRVLSPIFSITAVLHGLFSITMAILARKGIRLPKGVQPRSYPALNRKTVLQRSSAILMLLLLPLHIIGANTHYAPWLLYTITQPLFFAAVLLHTALSFTKALISLGIGTVKGLRFLDIVISLVCAILMLASTCGFYLYLFGGVRI